MGNLFKKSKSALSNYVGSVSGDANAIGDKLQGQFGSKEAISNMFDQRIAEGLSDLLTGATGIRTSNIPEINDAILQTKSANREARSKVLQGATSGRVNPYDNPPISSTLKYPENFVTEDGTSGELTNYMHFRSLQRRSVGKDTNEQVYDIFLYVPDDLSDSMSVTYTEAEKGLTEGAVASLFGAGGFAGSNQFASLKELGETIKAGAPGADILKAGAGKTINPLAFQLFEGVDMRTFSYNFKFQPLNASDSKLIREILYAFRKSMLPGVEGDNSRIYTFPNEWAIRYHGPIKQWIDYPMVTVCTQADVDWAASGEFTHHLDGAPTVVTLQLSFTELVALDRKKFDERVSGYMHGMGSGRETTQEGGSIGDIDTAAGGAVADHQAEQERLAKEEEERLEQERLAKEAGE